MPDKLQDISRYILLSGELSHSLGRLLPLISHASKYSERPLSVKAAVRTRAIETRSRWPQELPSWRPLTAPKLPSVKVGLVCRLVTQCGRSYANARQCLLEAINNSKVSLLRANKKSSLTPSFTLRLPSLLGLAVLNDGFEQFRML